MKKAVLIIGAGPYGICLAKDFINKGFQVLITTIEKENIKKLNDLGSYPIYTKNLHEDSCKEIHEKSMEFLKTNDLELKYIIHTARFAYYESTELDPPQKIREEMDKVNVESPKILAELFYETGCRFVFTSSAATKGFPNSLEKSAKPTKGNKKIGTKGLKYYSYTKRLGEEALYKFYKQKERLDLLAIICITLMHETNFFKDIGMTSPKDKGLTASEISKYVVEDVLRGSNRIYPASEIKFLMKLPRFIRIKILDSLEELYPL